LDPFHLVISLQASIENEEEEKERKEGRNNTKVTSYSIKLSAWPHNDEKHHPVGRK